MEDDPSLRPPRAELLKNHLLNINPFDGFQSFFHLENIFFLTKHLQKNETGRRAGIFVYIMQSQAGFNVASILRKELLDFHGFGR